MKKTVSLFVVLLVAAQLLSSLSVPIAQAQYNSGTAQDYLVTHANNPWSTMALASLGANSISSDYLKSVNGTSAIDYAAPILAITALNQDPKTFGNKNYVEELKKYHTSGQLGDASTVNDDIFGLLALISAGEPSTDSAATDAKTFITTHQQSNGGWGFATSGGTDSNMTAAAITALIASGTPGTDAVIQKGYDYLKTAQNNDGGFTYDPTSPYGTDSDSSSTAWVLWALNAGNQNTADWTKNSNSLVGYLESNQDTAGFFKYQAGSSEDVFSATTTAYAVIALTGSTLPIHKISGTPATPKFDFRIEGKDNTVCAGKAEGPTALDLVKNASTSCGFTYNIKTTSFGPYLEQINDDKAAGVIGWMYLVNNISPSVGANEFTLKTGDSTTWFFGDYNWKPTRLSLSSAKINSGATSTATIEYLNNDTWTALSSAKVLYGALNTTSGTDGKATISGPDGFYKVFGEKEGYIRSNSVLLQIGDPSSGDVSLSANLKKGDVKGETISFIVDTNSLDFGTITTGKATSKNLSIKNNGTVNIILESVVKGDDVFVNYLSLDNKPWKNFSKQFAIDQSQPVSASVNVPNNYSGSEGAKKGTVTFWATAQ